MLQSALRLCGGLADEERWHAAAQHLLADVENSLIQNPRAYNAHCKLLRPVIHPEEVIQRSSEALLLLEGL